MLRVQETTKWRPAPELGSVVIAADAWTTPDAKGPVSMFLGELRKRCPRATIVVVVDMVGIGYNLGKWPAADGYDVRGFIANGAPLNQTTFYDAKAEAFWTLGEWMKRGLFGLTDTDTQGQLIAIQYKPMPSGQIRIEPKDEMKKRGMRSPDRAEAAVMAYATLVPLRQEVSNKAWGERAVLMHR